MKNITKLLLLVSGASVVLVACSPATTSKNNTNTTSTSTTDSQTTLQQIDRTKWLYNETDNVYYQIGISYAGNQVDENQTLSIFIPGEYMSATSNGDGTYTADLNTNAKIGEYTSTTALQKLFSDLAPRYAERNGGYTRILKTEPRRGDAAPMAIIELV